MSGGRWGYQQFKLEDRASELTPLAVEAAGALRLLGAIEHELDWGHSNDTCLACARRRVIAALETYFGALEEGARDAIDAATGAAARGEARTACRRCLELPGRHPAEVVAAELARRGSEGDF